MNAEMVNFDKEKIIHTCQNISPEISYELQRGKKS